MAILYVRDKETRKIIKIVENYISLVWTERYQEAGDFVLQMPVSIENIDLFRRGRYISSDDSEESMIIQTVDLTESYGGDEENPVLEISGKSVTCILERRFNKSKLCEFQRNCVGTVSYSGKFSSVCQSIIENDAINPVRNYWTWWYHDSDGWHKGLNTSLGKSSHKIDTAGVESDPSRKINHLVFSNKVTSSSDPDIDVSYTKLMSLYDLINKLCKRYLMGFRVIINSDDNFEFQVYGGTDRTTNQKTLNPVIFNPIMDNISYVNYYEDDSNYKNYWFTYIDGYITFKFKNWDRNSSSIYQGYAGSYVTDGNSSENYPTDLDLYEIPFFSSAVSANDDFDPDEEFDTGEGETDPEGSYSALLTLIQQKVYSDGKTQFEDGDYEIVTTSEGAIDPLVRYHYGEDYFIGDRVDITNANGVIMTGIINEVVKSYDSDGIITTPNFMNMTEYDYGEEEETS